MTSTGDVLVTDDLDNAVYKLSNGANELTRIAVPNRFYPNGIALATDEKSVYVAHAFGVVRMEIDGGAITELQKPEDISLARGWTICPKRQPHRNPKRIWCESNCPASFGTGRKEHIERSAARIPVAEP